MAGLTAPADHQTIEGQVIEADGWFPGIDTDHVRKAIRLGEGSVTAERLAEAVIAGMLSGLRSMSAWRSAHAAAGIAALEQVSDLMLAGEQITLVLWRRIVTFYAAAELVDGHTDVSATDDALDREEDKANQADRYRRKAYEAVADLRAIGLPAGAPAPHGRNRVALL